MRNIRFAILAMAMLLSLSLSAQNLRQSVCVVYPELTEAERATLADYALYFAREGFFDEARMITASKSEGVFGSGVVISHDGQNYVITNRHVVGYAAKVKVDFMLPKQTITFDSCTVVGSSPMADLALILLPADCQQPALPLATMELEDGMDICAAGFPGLGIKPSWQLSKGSISNAQLYDKHLLGEEIAAIQHTAPIDGGSSGGPLLVQANDEYHIVGINTWKAAYRDGVGVAIPCSELQKFMLQDKTFYNDALSVSNPQQANLTPGQAWQAAYKALPDSTRQMLKKQDYTMPLDVIEQTDDCEKKIAATGDKNWEKRKKQTSKGDAKKGIDEDYLNKEITIGYTNYMFSPSQAVSARCLISIFNYDIFGMGVNVPMVQTLGYDEEPCQAIGWGAGFTVGAQVPCVIAPKQRLIPRFMVDVSVGFFSNSGVFVTPTLKVGPEYRYNVRDVALCLAAYYSFGMFHTNSHLAAEGYSVCLASNNYLQHGLTVTLGIAF